MSADKLTESDSLPDRGADVTDKPFPGASADREPASAPEPSPSMDQMRAAYANAGSASDIEASAKADEAAAARGSDTGTADPGESVPEVAATEVSEPAAEGAAVVPGTVVPDGDAEGPSAHPDGSALAGEVRQPEGTAGPERTDIPAFPGAPPDREPAPAPEPAPSMDQMREAFARSSNSEELQAAAKADEAAAKEAPAEKGTAAAKPGGDAAAGRDAVASGEPVAGESGEQQQGEEDGSGAAEETTPEQPVVLRAPQQEMPAAEVPEGEPAPLDGGRADASMVNQPDARHEDVVVLDQGEDTEAAEPTAEGIEPANEGVVATRSDVTAPEADDKPVVAGVVEPERPEAGVPPEEGDAGDTSASRSEVRLDSQSDDQRPVTLGDLKTVVAELQAENNAKLEAMEARNQSKIDDLGTKLDAARAEKTDAPGATDKNLERVEELESALSETRAERSKLRETVSQQQGKIEKLESRNDQLVSENDRLRARVAELEQHTDSSGEDPAADARARKRADSTEKEEARDESRRSRIHLPGGEAAGIFTAVVTAGDAVGTTAHVLTSGEASITGAAAGLVVAGYLWGKSKWEKRHDR